MPDSGQSTFDLPRSPTTLVDVLRYWAEKQPDERVFTLLADEESEEGTLTFGELDRQARAIAATLASLDLRGHRALLLYAPGLEYICGFLGCLYAGVVAVPAYPPDFARLERTLPRLQAIATDAEASVVLTSAGLLALADPILALADELQALRWLSTDTVDSGAARGWKPPPLEGRSLAFLQYTSGSTRSPRGVIVRHGNLLDNLELLRRALDLRPGMAAVSWVPPYHDMGLIGNILGTVYAGQYLVMMSPLTFLQRPFRWLRAMSRYRAAIGGAPNFAYDLCVRKTSAEERASLDLRSWRVALCGAEPIRDGTLERFASAFEQSGFRREVLFPAYGLAEATVIVSGGPSGNPPLVRTLLTSALERNLVVDAADGQASTRRVVGCGSPLQPVVVVDPGTLRRCASDRIGEVWVSGPSVAEGYWNRPEETAETFGARLEDTGEGPFLRTGDLGFVSDGQLFITGRRKDLIILHGANHHPHDIELTAEQSHPALRRGCGAAFSVDVVGEERLILLYEVDTAQQYDWEPVGAAVRAAVRREHRVDIHALAFVEPRSVPKTSSGKIQRQACKAAFLATSLDTVWAWRAGGTGAHAPPAPGLPPTPIDGGLGTSVAPETLVDVLRRSADAHPHEPVFTFLVDGESEAVTLTFSELDGQARAIATVLASRGLGGQRALLLYEPGLDYICGLLGCLYAGVVAVPAYPPDFARLERTLPRLQAIVTDAQTSVALTSAGILALADPILALADDLRALRWLSTDTVDASTAGDWKPPPLGGRDLAFLQYTSGSTRAPRGVMVSHANLLDNLELLRRAAAVGPRDTGVCWLPPYHDMGLVGNILESVYAGLHLVMMSPLAFLQRPIRWLQALSRYRAVSGGAPNFAYDLCVRKSTAEERATLDLSSWRTALCGAEPIHHETLERFASAFERSGFRRETFLPVYGLAEATVFVSGGPAGRPPVVRPVLASALERDRLVDAAPGQSGVRHLVGCGSPLLQVAVVVPQTSTRCTPDRIGEIWLSGPSVAAGYWNRPEETASTFGARLADSDEGPFLRTGDLGFVHDGQLFVTGRRKDLIILHGANHYPHDIELTAERSHPALRRGCGAAFSVDVAGEERLTLVYEVDTRQPYDWETVGAAVRAAVRREHLLELFALSLVAPRSVQKTSSGKIQHQACKAAFLGGLLETVWAWRAAATGTDALAAPVSGAERIEDDLRSRIAAELELDRGQLDPDEAVAGYGLDSITAVSLAYEIETHYGVQLPSTMLLEGVTIAGLAREIVRLEGRAVERPAAEGPRASREPADHGLSYGERALWFVDQLAPASLAYHIVRAFRTQQKIDAAALKEAVEGLISRHAALRTSYVLHDGELLRRIEERAEEAFRAVDATGWTPAELDRRLREEADRPFDLARPALFRVRLFRRSGEDVLVFALHHIVADWWSLAVLARDLEELYRAERDGRPPALGPLTSQYTDYVRWQADLLAGPDGERQWAFWERKLAGAPQVLHLPTDRPRPPLQTSRGSTYAFRLSRAITTRLQEVARTGDATLYMTLVAALQILLHRYSGQHDVVVRSPMLGRRHGRFASLVGYCVNPVVLRADLSDDPPFETFLQEVRRNVIAAMANQDYPFPLLVERLHPVRDPSRSPFFQVMFEWLGDPWRDAPALAPLALSGGPGGLAFAGLMLETVPLEQHGAQFDLTLRMAAVDGCFSGAWQYNADLFDAPTIARLHASFAMLLESVVAEPGRRVGSLPLMTGAERRRILVEWNATATPALPERCLHELFEAQAARTPERTAIIFAGHALTYGDLDRRANQVAHHLRGLGIGPEDLVGLLVERSADMVVALLGIQKAGAAYVPLDPSYPFERLALMLEDSRVAVVLTVQPPAERLQAPGRRIVRLDESSHHPSWTPAVAMPPDSLAYVIYTSGSTGTPKGVQITHRGLVHLLVAMAEQLKLTERDVFLAVTSLSFDIAALELLSPLVTGGRVVIAPREEVADGRRLAALIAGSGATVMQATPSVWRMLVDCGWSGDRGLTALCGGDTLSRDLADRLCERTSGVWNLYGPTETTIWSSFHRVGPGGGAVPIGRPIANTELYVLDPQLHPVPIGVAGELHIGGVGLARGYHGSPALTAERFIPHPFSGDGRARLYKTGDLARYLEDGSLEYLGRRDEQTKVRGFRVELGEIEAALCRHGGVRNAVVVARGDADRDRHLMAYVVGRGDEAPTAAELRAWLGDRLPSYMVPTRFAFLERIPLLPNGKIDRAALPEATRHPAGERESARPRSSLEGLLVTLWADVLGAVPVGRDDDFFDLGGHSLQAAQLAARVSDATGREIPVQFIVCNPTPAAAAAALEADPSRPDAPSRSLPAPAGIAGGGTPSSLVTIEHRPLVALVAAGRIAPVDAAALAYFPRALLSRTDVTAEEVVQTWCGDLPLVAAIDDTPVGRLATLILPRFDTELYGDPDDLARITHEAVTTAAGLGARTVALTGLLASALDYDRTLGAHNPKAAITTGHATTCAAVVSTIGEILKAAGRDLASERVAFLGLGSLGAATLELMLACLPHPVAIALCDTFANRERLEVLVRSAREAHRFRGAVQVLPSRGDVPPEVYRASLIVGATNVPDLIDVGRLRAGTVIVDDSAPHCFRPSDAFRRLESAGDILFAEGGVLRAPSPIPQLRYLPQSLAPFRESLMESFPVADDRHAIPACMLSALLSARFQELGPTLGPVDIVASVEHYRALGRLGFVATDLRCGRRVLDEATIERFRSSFGNRS